MHVALPRRRSRLRWPFVAVLLLAVAGLAVRYVVLSGRANGTPRDGATGTTAQGTTAQGTSFDLGIHNQHVAWLRTSLKARCAGGTTWKATWSPAEDGPVHFITAGQSLLAQEHVETSYPGGTVGRIGFALHGTLTGPNSAQGTIRLVARFYRGEREWNACDSLDVPWAVGPHASGRLPTVQVGRKIGEYFPAVPSMAGAVSPARRRFVNLVDGVCVGTYNEIARAQAKAAREYGYFDDHVLLESEYYVLLHTWQLKSLARLGSPPQAAGLYEAWLTNFRQRVSVERQAVILYAHEHLAAARRKVSSLTRLKADGNLLGQRFGLVRCTSNGDRTPVPILNDNQPLPLP